MKIQLPDGNFGQPLDDRAALDKEQSHHHQDGGETETEGRHQGHAETGPVHIHGHEQPLQEALLLLFYLRFELRRIF
jgi:hypothetical protein